MAVNSIVVPAHFSGGGAIYSFSGGGTIYANGFYCSVNFGRSIYSS